MWRVEIGRGIEGLERGGFQTLWERQIKHSNMLGTINWPRPVASSDYISMNMLSSFFITVGITMILLGLVLIAEAISDKGRQGCVNGWHTIAKSCVRFTKFFGKSRSRTIRVTRFTQ